MRLTSSKGFGCTAHKLEEKQPILDWCDRLTDEQADQLRTLIRARFHALWEPPPQRQILHGVVQDFIEEHGGDRDWFII